MCPLDMVSYVCVAVELRKVYKVAYIFWGSLKLEPLAGVSGHPRRPIKRGRAAKKASQMSNQLSFLNVQALDTIQTNTQT